MNLQLKPHAKETSHNYQTSSDHPNKEEIVDFLRCGQRIKVQSRADRVRDSSDDHLLQHPAVTPRGDSRRIAISCSPADITTSQDFAQSDEIVNDVVAPSQKMCRRSAMALLEGADEVDGVSRRKQISNSGKSKSLKDLFEDLDVETNICIRYRRRSIERRSALSMLIHPPFETILENDDADQAEDPDPDELLAERRNNFLTAEEKLSILRKVRSAGLLDRQEKMSIGALQNSVFPEGTEIATGAGLVGPTRSSFIVSKGVSSLSDLGAKSSYDHARDIMVQKRTSFVSLRMLKRGKLINEGIGSVLRNPESLHRVSVVEDKKKRTTGGVMQVEKQLELLSNTIRRTTTFLGIFNAAGEEPEDTNTLRRSGDTQSNTIGRTTSFLGLFKVGKPEEKQEEDHEKNVLLENMKEKDSINLVNALQCNGSWGG